MAIASRNRVFISYSHHDKRFLQRLHVHLAYYEREGLIDYWDDTRLDAGDDWKQAIKDTISSAKVAILLVSADFLASRFIAENELPPLLKAAENAGVKIISVVLSPCGFDKTPLARYQAVHDTSKPLGGLPKHAKEAIWAKLAGVVSQELTPSEVGNFTSSTPTPDFARPFPSIFAIASLRGGTGKTTSAIHIAASLSEMACRTLIIDLDPEQIATAYFGLPNHNNSLALLHYLVDSSTPLHKILQTEVRPYLSLLPGGRDLANDKELLRGLTKPDFWLSTIISAIEKSQRTYDFILIDCPPDADLLTRNACVASHGIIIPAMCRSIYSLNSVSETMNLIKSISNQYAVPLEVFGIVLTGYDLASESSKSIAASLRSAFPLSVFSTYIPPISQGFQADNYRRTLLELDPDSPSSQAYRKLAREIIAKSYQIRISQGTHIE